MIRSWETKPKRSKVSLLQSKGLGHSSQSQNLQERSIPFSMLHARELMRLHSLDSSCCALLLEREANPYRLAREVDRPLNRQQSQASWRIRTKSKGKMLSFTSNPQLQNSIPRSWSLQCFRICRRKLLPMFSWTEDRNAWGSIQTTLIINFISHNLAWKMKQAERKERAQSIGL